MKNSTTSVLGFDVPTSGQPETLAECVAAAGGEQIVVDQYVGYSNAHKTNGDARAAVVEALEEVTGIKRATEKVKAPTKSDPNRTVDKFSESEQTYADRVRAETGQKTEELWPLIADKVGVIPFKCVGEPRTGAGRVGKEDAKNAETLLASDVWKNAVELLSQKNPGLEIAVGDDGKPTVESLAAALRTNRQRIDKEAKAELGIAA